MMSDVRRIFVVESDENLNQSLVNSLRKDGYVVQGGMSGADVVRVLWKEEYNVVICGLMTPGADGFELLQWLRAYRPNTAMIMLGNAGDADSAALRIKALEGGAAGYLEKPLDMRALKEELRRLLQQTGFSASLDSFDLLDVIQIITMSRKSITLLVNTGLEEHGTLSFQNGDLMWAEYGVLRGEEAFFALAAHMNGTVVQQPWDKQVISNVTQPLSRLIFQALQYRTKYANRQQVSGEIARVSATPLSALEVDDTPFVVLPDSQPQLQAFHNEDVQEDVMQKGKSEDQDGKEWWEKTGRVPSVGMGAKTAAEVTSEETRRAPSVALNPQELSPLLRSTRKIPTPQERQPAANQRSDLPSWLTDQPTSSGLPTVASAPGVNAADLTAVPATPRVQMPSGEWPQINMPNIGPMTDQLYQEQVVNVAFSASASVASMPPVAAPEQLEDAIEQVYTIQNVTASSITTNKVADRAESSLEQKQNTAAFGGTSPRLQQVARRNYAALVSALQTLGYAIAGFVAAAVVTIDGVPVAQVAVDDIDVSEMSKHLSTIQRSVHHLLSSGEWGSYEDTIITSAERRFFMHGIGSENKAFLILLTTRTADETECLAMISNVEETIGTALR